MLKTDLARNAAAAFCTLVASATFLAAAIAPAQQNSGPSGPRAVVATARLTA